MPGSRARSLEQRLQQALNSQHRAEAMLNDVITKHNALVDEWNAIVRQINKRGGEAFLYGSIKASEQLTQEDIRTLISLCHPDKHGNKPSATRMTQKLIGLRG